MSGARRRLEDVDGAADRDRARGRASRGRRPPSTAARIVAAPASSPVGAPRSRRGRRPSRRGRGRRSAPRGRGDGRAIARRHRDAPDGASRRRGRAASSVARSPPSSRRGRARRADPAVPKSARRRRKLCRRGRRPRRRSPRSGAACAPAPPVGRQVRGAGHRQGRAERGRQARRRRDGRRGRSRTSVASVSGAGRTLNVTSLRAPRACRSEPARNFTRSRPVTFFITRPPDFTTSPRPVTARTPIRPSRAAPAAMRRGPERLAAATRADGRRRRSMP